MSRRIGGGHKLCLFVRTVRSKKNHRKGWFFLALASSLVSRPRRPPNRASVTCFVNFHRRSKAAQKCNKMTPLALKITGAAVIFMLELILHRLRLFVRRAKSNKKPTAKGGFFIGSGCLIRTGDQSVNSRLLYR